MCIYEEICMLSKIAIYGDGISSTLVESSRHCPEDAKFYVLFNLCTTDSG